MEFGQCVLFIDRTVSFSFQDGGTALLLAAMKGHTDIVRDILSLKGVLVNLEDKVFVFVVKCGVFYFCSHL